LSLEVDGGKSLLLNWDRSTSWKNLKLPADLRVDDVLAVDYIKNGDQAVAKSVSLVLPSVPAGMKTVSIETLGGYLGTGAPLPFTLIDVRPADRFEEGHLSGAVSVPLRRIEKKSAGILPEDRSTPVVFYDEGAGDGSAVKAAELSMKAGYANVAVFPDGAAGWYRSGGFLVSSSSFLRKTKGIIIIDLRKPEQVAAGHIERATSIPAAKLETSRSLFPMRKRAPIVVYGENDDEVLAAARTIRAWGYRQVTIYPGGVKAWLGSAEVLTNEPASEFILPETTSKSAPLKPKDFELALMSPLSVQIVDVRSDADYAKGYLPKSVHIPLQQLSARHGELDKEMILVVFAADEVQAEMAADFLTQKDYRVNYLHGRVDFQSDGKYQVK
ncbi:MAG TPA: rhodanese-like domain-containing protein, partial [Geobacteraceae bacterium]|nr:rhodanese-like domain-containing protein [Geobacteraceae bacterium]